MNEADFDKAYEIITLVEEARSIRHFRDTGIWTRNPAYNPKDLLASDCISHQKDHITGLISDLENFSGRWPTFRELKDFPELYDSIRRQILKLSNHWNYRH